MEIKGSFVLSYFICERQLWFESKKINMQHSSELVKLGKTIHEFSFKRNRKEITLDGIKLDFIKKKDKLFIHEIKKSDKMAKAHY